MHSNSTEVQVKKGPLYPLYTHNWMPTKRHWNHTETASSFSLSPAMFFSVKESLTSPTYTCIYSATNWPAMHFYLLTAAAAAALHCTSTYNHIRTFYNSSLHIWSTCTIKLLKSMDEILSVTTEKKETELYETDMHQLAKKTLGRQSASGPCVFTVLHIISNKLLLTSKPHIDLTPCSHQFTSHPISNTNS